MKIKSTEGFKSMKMNFPEVGTQEIDAEGIVEIQNEEVAEKLIAGSGWEQLQEEIMSDDVEHQIGEEESEEESDEEEKQKLIDSLESMNLEDLCSLAVDSGIKGWEKFKKNETALRSYLKKRI